MSHPVQLVFLLCDWKLAFALSGAHIDTHGQTHPSFDTLTSPMSEQPRWTELGTWHSCIRAFV